MIKIFRNIILLSIVLQSFACKNNNQSARPPIQHKQQNIDMTSVNHNRNLKQREETFIKQMIEKDSLHQYIDSGHGFWYYYAQKNTKQDYLPKKGDKLSLMYEVRDLANNIIYSEKEIGNKTYIVDHENFFRGFREAVKLLKENEEAWFFFPSNAAFAFHGDENRIGQNVPLKVKINVLKIEKQKINEHEKN